ncbi:hypothetical protein HDU93_007181 [Gonapodya sp. JEL0774]|nr:hypothetical protein HDU93_007181 [Gonapodya sp. JEL0774]
MVESYSPSIKPLTVEQQDEPFDDSEFNIASQDEEILALQAIFGDAMAFDEQSREGRIVLAVDLPPTQDQSEDSLLVVRPYSEGPGEASCRISCLPPVTLKFSLWPQYPSDVCVDTEIDAKWLDRAMRDQLESRIREIWKEGGRQPCIFSLAEFLRTESISYLASQTETQLQGQHCVTLFSEDPTGLVDMLVMNDREVAQRKFDKELFQCLVCFDEYRARLGEGDHRSVGECLDIACAKLPHVDMVTTTPTQTDNPAFMTDTMTASAVTSPDISRRGRLSRATLQIVLDGETYSRSRTVDRFIEIFLKHGGHRGLIASITRQLATVDLPRLEQEFDASMIDQDVGGAMRERNEQDSKRSNWLSIKYVKEQSTMCPKCKAPVVKDVGCDHIACRCGYDFCYVCGKAWGHPGECSRPSVTDLEPEPIVRSITAKDVAELFEKILQGYR